MKNIWSRLTVLFATGFGIGMVVSIGQGTAAAFVFLLFVPLFLKLNILWQIGLVVSSYVLGVFVSWHVEKSLGTHDDHRIVIDEIVSIFITFIGLGADVSLAILLIGFLLNRILDIFKPFPIRLLERLPHGWGVMSDDIAAGILARGILYLLIFFV